jgi:hypothetical protein
MKKKPPKKAARNKPATVKIPAEIPVHAAVVIVATDPRNADTLYNHVAEWLHKAGAGFAAFFHEDKY